MCPEGVPDNLSKASLQSAPSSSEEGLRIASNGSISKMPSPEFNIIIYNSSFLSAQFVPIYTQYWGTVYM